MIRAVGVVIPVHDEEASLARCLTAIRRAADHVSVPVHVVAVLDACTDRSGVIAREAGVEACSIIARNVGAARRFGADRVVDRFNTFAPSEVWLATTDADSSVPSHWLSTQLASNAEAVAGTVVVEDWGSYDRAAAYEQFYAQGGEHHPHVHGTNLGVRLDRYLEVGGFEPLTTGEDVRLWRALEALPDRHLVKTRSIPVVTSARLVGRAPKGFAAFLDDFQASA